MAGELIKADYQSLIFEFRGYKVMVDTDLATLYETEAKVLKQQVKRNIDRFPKAYMFELTKVLMQEGITGLMTNMKILISQKTSCLN